ncbi:MAG: acetyl-CoA carboxylase biotin carboxyl carrier protein [Vulcanimicrobiaceae bacterium]
MESRPEISYEEIAQILKVIESSSLDELHLEIGGIVLDVRRNGAGSRPMEARPAPPAAPVAPAPIAAPVAPRAAESATPLGSERFSVTSPMLGTFYRAPAPGAPPFVEIGSVVRKGDTLCIIEVMKLINTIAATRDGRVVELPVANAEIVEYGQEVMVLEPV